MSTEKKKTARKSEDLGFFGLTGSLEQNLRRMQLIREQNREEREEAERLGVSVFQLRYDKYHEDNKPIVVDLASFPIVELEWLWPKRIPMGKITIFSGDPGLGKSYVALDIAARVSNGDPWPGEEEDAETRGNMEGEMGRGEEGKKEEGSGEKEGGSEETEGQNTDTQMVSRDSERSVEEWKRERNNTLNVEEVQHTETESSLAERIHVLQTIIGQIRESGRKNAEKEEGKKGGGENGKKNDSAICNHHSAIRTPARVLILSAEDNAADTIHPRLERLGANIDNIKILTRVKNDGEYDFFSITRDIDHLERAIREMKNCKLVIIDPLASYLGNMGGSSLSAVRKALDPLRRVAEEHDVAIILINHLNKKSGSAIHRSAGSISIVGMARVVWGFTKCKADEKRRLMVPLKNNLADDSEGLAYSVTDGKIAWDEEPLEISADEAFGDQEKLRGRNPYALREAMDWLREKLSSGEAIPQITVEADAREAEIKETTLRRAKQKLGVIAKHGHAEKCWLWQLPLVQTTVV